MWCYCRHYFAYACGRGGGSVNVLREKKLKGPCSERREKAHPHQWVQAASQRFDRYCKAVTPPYYIFGGGAKAALKVDVGGESPYGGKLVDEGWLVIGFGARPDAAQHVCGLHSFRPSPTAEYATETRYHPQYKPARVAVGHRVSVCPVLGVAAVPCWLRVCSRTYPARND